MSEYETSISNGDPVVAAIDEFSQSIEENNEEGQVLLDELSRFRQERISGTRLLTAIGYARPPLIFAIARRLIGRLTTSNAHLRQTVVVTAIAEEGESVNAIARRFGVTHQRISSILRRETKGTPG